MTRAALLAYIDNNVYPNANNEITALMVRDVLHRMVDFLGDAATYGVGDVALNNGGLVTGGAVQSAINTTLSSAIMFQGVTTTPLTDGSTNPNITIDGESYTAHRGDEVIYGGKEFLWTGSKWQQLGDEESWAAKTITISAGTGLTGGGNLTQNRTLSLSQDSLEKLALAASAYQLPQGGIPKTDLASAVQNSLGKADTVAGYFSNDKLKLQNLPDLYVARTQVSGTAANKTIYGVNGISAAAAADANDKSLIEWDDTNKVWHVHGGIYAEGVLSGGGLSQSSPGGGGGLDPDLMWKYLTNDPTLPDNQHVNDKIAAAHLPDLLAGSGLRASYSGNLYLDLSLNFSEIATGLGGIGAAASRGVASSIGAGVAGLTPGSLIQSVLGDGTWDSTNTVKAFVNSSIATATATFRGTNTTATTEAQFLAWANALTHDLNDYVFWATTDSSGNTVYKRYKYDGTNWIFEYDLNNSSFTAAQWSAINSGVTATKVGTYDTIASYFSNGLLSAAHVGDLSGTYLPLNLSSVEYVTNSADNWALGVKNTSSLTGCYIVYREGNTTLGTIGFNSSGEPRVQLLLSGREATLYHTRNLSLSSLVGSSVVGGATEPVYYTGSALAACSTYAGGTAVTLNGTSAAASTASFYAPTSSGTTGQILKATSSGAPVWTSSSLGDTNKPIYLNSSGVLSEGVACLPLSLSSDTYVSRSNDNWVVWFRNNSANNGSFIGFDRQGTSLGTIGFTTDGKLLCQIAAESWAGYNIYHSGNSNKSNVAWACSNLEASGTIHASTGIYTEGYLSGGGLSQSSDRRLKTAIKDFAYTPALLMAISPREWDWNGKAAMKGHAAGFVAQEIEGPLPYAVDNAREYKALFYDHFHALEVAALQDHERRIVELEKAVEDRDRQIAELRQRLNMN